MNNADAIWKAAYMQAMCACAIVEAIAELANIIKTDGKGSGSPERILDLINKYGIHHNAVLEYMR